MKTADAVPSVVLRALTDDDRDAFFREEIASYADQQVRDAGWPLPEALDRASKEFGPVLEREYVEAVERGERLWSAIGPQQRPVGWLWVKLLDGSDVRSAFLYQITVVEHWRRRGYGRAMLDALEELLAAEGLDELHLNVFVANEPARRLYAAADYEQVGADDRRIRLRKRLAPSRR